ncbi:3-oxoacyl-ACP synthase III family protein [Streptomyces fulvorobeus]|uniref:3-oxoacyl-ACP synthase n=1 Tax=Streptomyces fulvorobeus TaxID=284028 RepID=A0A7J0C4V3_9ACTN|nr:ketoacyl-ACP synthase III [Streptomyces fulvorobeus]NYE40626.1 3-oxoacyl-[acyl-carrier-protein] synthase-3 [Streptomyces fulvorobeus]GFM96923.1 3-oxoacyl-ACP synthase [Streptomyces fulvorobeus]
MTVFSRIREVVVHIPDGRQSGQEIEERLRAQNPHLLVVPGVLDRMYGLEERCVAPADTWPSDLAAAAAGQVLDRAGLAADAVDLLIFASVCSDMEEPATSHIVAAKLGVTAPVFDVRNACNGVLNALQLADALIRDGQYERVLVVTGETVSRLSCWDAPDRWNLALSLPGLTMGDMGAALLMEASATPGVLGTHFVANSAGWQAATLVNPFFGDGRPATLRVDSDALLASFAEMVAVGLEALHSMGVKVDDLAAVCVHQASVAFTETFCDALGIPADKVISTFPRYGNVATASLPLQLAESVDSGRLRDNDLVALFGLASGASAGLALIQW